MEAKFWSFIKLSACSVEKEKHKIYERHHHLVFKRLAIIYLRIRVLSEQSPQFVDHKARENKRNPGEEELDENPAYGGIQAVFCLNF